MSCKKCATVFRRSAGRGEHRGRVCYRNWTLYFGGESKGGFLSKRVSNSAGESQVAAPTNESARPSMHEVFGPGGFLEKCMVAGFDRSTVSSDYEYRPPCTFRGILLGQTPRALRVSPIR